MAVVSRGAAPISPVGTVVASGGVEGILLAVTLHLGRDLRLLSLVRATLSEYNLLVPLVPSVGEGLLEDGVCLLKDVFEHRLVGRF